MTSTTTSVEESFVDVADGRVHVYSGGSGDPLVVLHSEVGLPGWLPFHDALAARYRVIIPEIPGYGGSDRPEWARTFRDLAILERQAITALGLDSVHLVGVGFGGWIAAELATMNDAMLRSLTLVNPAGIKPTEGRIYDQLLVSAAEYLQHGFHDQSKRTATFGEEPDVDTLEALDIAREMTTRVGWSPYGYNQRLPYLLKGVRTPALVIHGANDEVIPQSTIDQYGSLLPNARVETLANAGYFADMEQPEQLAGLVADFAAKAS